MKHGYLWIAVTKGYDARYLLMRHFFSISLPRQCFSKKLIKPTTS
jgi:hypothetical protein